MAKTKVVLRADKGRLQLRWTLDGERITFSLGLADTAANRGLAQRKARIIEDDLTFGSYDETLEKYRPQQRSPQKKITLMEVWDAYLVGHVVKLAPKTQALFRTMDKHVRKLPGYALEKPLEATDWLAKNCTLGTAKRIVKSLGSACRWAKRRGMLPFNPFEDMTREIPSPPRKDSEVEVFSPAEIETILRAYSEHPQYKRFLPLVKFLALTGCRPEEAIGLRWKNVKPDHILFCEAITYLDGRSVEMSETKTKKPRRFPINDELRALLKSLPKDRNAFVFPASNPYKPVNYNHFYRSWHGCKSGAKRYIGIVMKLSEDMEISQYLCPYSLRHSFITRCLERNIPPGRVARWVGNSPRMIFEFYLGAIEDCEVPTLE
jgi:integrase